MPQDSEANIELTSSDRDKICEFSKANTLLEELLADEKKSSSEIQNLNIAYEELELLMDDEAPISYRIGDVFVTVTCEEAMKLIQGEAEGKKNALNDITCKLNACRNKISELKNFLYAKLGDQIQLEN